MLAANISPSTVIAAIIVIVVLALIIAPGLADSVAVAIGDVRDLFKRGASRAWGIVRSYWGLGGMEKRERALLNRITRRTIEKTEKARNKLRANTLARGGQNTTLDQVSGQPSAQGLMPLMLSDEEKAQIAHGVETTYGKPQAPTAPEMVTAWTIRFVYLVLVMVCVFSDYVFTSSRAGPIIGGSFTPPSYLVGFFQALPVITGVLFVSIAALAGMLIGEFLGLESNAVKIWPYIPDPVRYIGLALAVLMFLLDLVSVLFLVLVAFYTQHNLSRPGLFDLTVLAGIAAVIALGVLLAWPGLWQGASALVLLVFLGIGALILSALMAVCIGLWLMVSLLAVFNRALWQRGPTSKEPPIAVDQRNIAVVGYGNTGTQWATQVYKQIALLSKSGIWLAGTATGGQVISPVVNEAIRQLSAGNISARDAAELRDKLEHAFNRKPEKETKTLLWIVEDSVLDECLDSLIEWNTTTRVKNIKLVVLLVVSPEDGTVPRRSLAADLKQWADKPNSILANVIVVDSDSPLADAMPGESDHLLWRSIAALLVARSRDGQAKSFAQTVTELHTSGYLFSYLASGSIGITPQADNWNTGTIAGRRGEYIPQEASNTLQKLGAAALHDQRLSSVPDKAIDKPAVVREPVDPADQYAGGVAPNPAQAQQDYLAEQRYQEERAAYDAALERLEAWRKQQAASYVNVVVPKQLDGKKRDMFREDVCNWLRRQYGIVPQRVAVIASLNDKVDHGIDVSREPNTAAWSGAYYLHFTAFRGLTRDGQPAMPRQLAGGTPSAERMRLLAPEPNEAGVAGYTAARSR